MPMPHTESKAAAAAAAAMSSWADESEDPPVSPRGGGGYSGGGGGGPPRERPRLQVRLILSVMLWRHEKKFWYLSADDHNRLCAFGHHSPTSNAF